MHRHLFAALGLALIVLVAYANVWDHGFLLVEDPTYTNDSRPVLRGLSVQGVHWAFVRSHGRPWQPLAWLSLMADAEIQGVSPDRFHATNLILHLANTVLLYAFLVQATGMFWPALFAAALLGVHPIHVESVAWISARGDLLGLFFTLLALVAYVPYARRGGVARYLLVLLLAVGAIFSRPALGVLPVLLLLVDYWPLDRLGIVLPRRLLLEKLPLLVLSLVVAIAVTSVGRATQDPPETVHFASKLAVALHSSTVYVCKLVWPVNLALFYPRDALPRTPGKVLEAGLFLMVVTWIVVRAARTQPFLVTGWGWFLVSLAPALRMNAMGDQLLADRWANLPFIGLYIMVAYSAAELYGRVGDSWRMAIGLACGMTITLFVAVSARQSSHWATSESLFRHSLAVTENNARAHQYLGVALAMQGKLDEAMAELTEARRLRPNDVRIMNDLAGALLASGRVEDARQLLEEALERNPNFAETYLNLGRLDRVIGQFEPAVERFRTALVLKQDLVPARLEMGICLAELGRFNEAIDQYQQALLYQDDFHVHLQFGRILSRAKDFDGALRHLSIAQDLEPQSAAVRSNVADVLWMRGDARAAESNYLAALELDPNLAEAHRGLALLLARAGRLKEAYPHFQRVQQLVPSDTRTTQDFSALVVWHLDALIAHYTQTVKLHPEDAASHGTLAHALAARRRHREAIEHLQAALALKPDWLDGANNLAWMLATLNEPNLRNGKEAVRWAAMVCEKTGHGNVEYLDTLAAAYAEMGDFAEAVRIAETARQIAKANGQDPLAEVVEARAKRYRQKQPYRENTLATPLP